MKRYAARRIAALVIVLWGVSILAFSLGSLAPGDPAEIRLLRQLGHPPTEEELTEKRREMGLDRPVLAQYVSWAGGALQGDLGRSWGTGEEVSDLLWEHLPRTAILAATSLGLAVMIALPLGVLAAHRRNSAADHGSRIAALLGASLPTFFIGYLLMFVFGVELGLLPVFGFTTPLHLILPSVTLGLASAAILTRLTRSSVLEVLGEDFIRIGRAMGLHPASVLFRHALRNALVPVLTVIGLSFGHLLSGTVIVEWIFSWPGLGKLAIDAIHARDLPLIQGFVLVTGTMYVLVNLLTDLTYVWADPRVRLQGQAG